MMVGDDLMASLARAGSLLILILFNFFGADLINKGYEAKRKLM